MPETKPKRMTFTSPISYGDMEQAIWLVKMLAQGTTAMLPMYGDASNPREVEVGFVGSRFIEDARDLLRKIGA